MQMGCDYYILLPKIVDHINRANSDLNYSKFRKMDRSLKAH